MTTLAEIKKKVLRVEAGVVGLIAERDRLKAENAELLDKLRLIERVCVTQFDDAMSCVEWMQAEARAALAEHEAREK